MEPSKRSLSRLESMPDDMLRLIVSKVGASSSADYCNTMMACKSLNFGLDDPLICQNTQHHPHGGETQYLLRYFDLGNPVLGLYHLRIASKGAHKEAKYLYGVLLMATGMISKGKKILSKLTEDIGLESVETSWDNVQASLSHLTVEMKEVYVDSLISMEPELNCHPPGVNTVCYKCYHAYLMTEFFEMALGLNPAPAAA
ncbi:hypothetical protein YC2023_010824 [Brassica napus]